MVLFIWKILLFSVNSVLKSLLSALTHTRNAPVALQRNKFHQGALTVLSFLVIFVVTSLKLDKIGLTLSSLNPYPSLPSAATDAREQIQCLNVVLNNKTEALFLEFN